MADWRAQLLQDLRAKREQIDAVIHAVEALDAGLVEMVGRTRDRAAPKSATPRPTSAPSARTEKVLAALQGGGKSLSEIASATGLTKSLTKYQLEKLHLAGRLKRTGQTAASKYALA